MDYLPCHNHGDCPETNSIEVYSLDYDITTTTFCQVGRLVREHLEGNAMPDWPQEVAMEFEDDDESDDDSGLEELGL